MKISQMLLLFLFTSPFYQSAFAQDNSRLFSGTITDTAGQILVGVTMKIKKKMDSGKIILSGSTNSLGRFQFSLAPGDYLVACSYVGFRFTELNIQIVASTKLNIIMEESGAGLQEIVISGTKKPNTVKNLDIGVQSINLQTLKKMPALMGEVDVVRSVLSLPGVSSVGEGSSGFNVRGGNVDQNLVLMDGSPVFNTSHLFGLFSVFNPEVVQDVKLVKGGIAAEYGGRLSSVMDIRLKGGNPDSISVSGGIGSVSARLAAGIPILNGRGSIFLAGRRTYADLFLKLAKDENLKSTSAYFQDFNLKGDYRINKKAKLSLAGYFGNDKLGMNKEFTIAYHNANAAATLMQEFSSSLSAKTALVFSRFGSSLTVIQEPQSALSEQYINHYQLKTDWNYHKNIFIDLTFGLSAIRYDVNPGSLSPLNDGSVFNPVKTKQQVADELAIYLGNAHRLTDKLSAQYGLRLSHFNAIAAGDENVITYGGTAGKELLPIQTLVLSKGSSIANYINYEPRLSLRYLLSANSSIKAGYNRMAQYVHLISATTASTPLDSWMTSTNNIRPELADQYSAGYFFAKSAYELSAEVYYKSMSNQVDVINGTEPIGNPDIEKDLVYGEGRSLGLEIYLKKNSGKLNGYIGYTLSKTERKINGINNGEWYNAKYDRTHNLNMVAVYNYSTRWSFSANYVFQTGVAATFPSSRSEFQGILVPFNNGDVRNNYRYSPYTRLDLSANLSVKHRAGSKFSSNWVFSLYNVLNRQNVYAIYFQQDTQIPNKTVAKQLSVIGSIVPGVTWNFNF